MRLRGDMGGKLNYRHVLFIMSERPCVTKRVPSVILRADPPRNQLTAERDTFKTCALCEWGLIYFKHIFLAGGGGLIETGGLLNLARTMVSVLHKELEYRVEKLKYQMLEVIQLRIKNKSEPPVSE